jgi:hypothetical protein
LFTSVTGLGEVPKEQRFERDISDQGWHLWLDKAAEWKGDKLFLPPVRIDELPVNPPTCGWESLMEGRGKKVRLPATVEEHFWGENGNTYGVTGNYTGVSWFSTHLKIPARLKGRRVVLLFESARMRAEVYLNGRLVGYDLVHGTPFEVDITEFAKYGEKNFVAVRITDPNGNFAWLDYGPYKWGDTNTPASHGFGGITGKVTLIATDWVYIADIFVKNKPSIEDIDVEITLENQTKRTVRGQLDLTVVEYGADSIPLLHYSEDVTCEAGGGVIVRSFKVDQAKPWSIAAPHLYMLFAKWTGSDGSKDDLTRRFGFRWFEIKNVDGDRQFYLNSKRIVLRSAISWGFWPGNGIYPAPEMARRQIETAKMLGLNMLNFHRAIGQTVVLDLADELGLLYYEEPGGYATRHDVFCRRWNRQRLLRMVRRDRSHPSLVIYNMQNEVPKGPWDYDKEIIAAAHQADETRIITFTSTFTIPSSGTSYGGGCQKGAVPLKLHMVPYDNGLYYQGWCDQHHAGGFGVYRDKFYNGPEDYLRYTDDSGEIIFFGEEGAIGAPPRLQLVRDEITKGYPRGWDGDDYIERYDAYEKFLKEKGFTGAFPTVDSFTQALGSVPFYYQGRVIENIRINNIVDGYVINGWEGSKIENHSGIVDCFRNPKGKTELISHYNQPLFVAVKVRDKVVETGSQSRIDIHLVNEVDLKGNYTLNVQASDRQGVFFDKDYAVNVVGGTTYGQLLVDGVAIATRVEGYCDVSAFLKRGEEIVAEGKDQIYAVTLDASGISPSGMIADRTGHITRFLSTEVGLRLATYQSGKPEGDYLVVDQNPNEIETIEEIRADLTDWVSDGHTLVIVTNARKWAEFLHRREVIDYRGGVALGIIQGVARQLRV